MINSSLIRGLLSNHLLSFKQLIERHGSAGVRPIFQGNLSNYRCFSSSVEEIMACLPFYAKGEVVKGFGRGSKELGIPTANMPESVVENLPKPLTTGIYFGLSNVDSGKIYKTVLSIGWNPFYHNVKKSLEAHLIHEFPADFYGSELKLIILGYIRPEMNYNSLELLIEAINNDIEVAKSELDKTEFQSYLKDEFFTKELNSNSTH